MSWPADVHQLTPCPALQLIGPSPHSSNPFPSLTCLGTPSLSPLSSSVRASRYRITFRCPFPPFPWPFSWSEKKSKFALLSPKRLKCHNTPIIVAPILKLFGDSIFLGSRLGVGIGLVPQASNIYLAPPRPPARALLTVARPRARPTPRPRTLRERNMGAFLYTKQSV